MTVGVAKEIQHSGVPITGKNIVMTILVRVLKPILSVRFGL